MIKGLRFTVKGGKGSGNFGHAGRPGSVGGSTSGGGRSTEITHAQGVLAARRLGGQVPQKDVNAAERTLRRAGLLPTTRKAPKGLSKEYLSNFYEKHKPVTGDRWNMPKGGYAEVGNISQRRTFSLEGKWETIPGHEINIHMIGRRGGRTTSIYNR